MVVVPWGTVEGLPNREDLLGHLVAEVLINRIQGPGTEELPEDLVGRGATRRATVEQQDELHLGLFVKLKDLKYIDELEEGRPGA